MKRDEKSEKHYKKGGWGEWKREKGSEERVTEGEKGQKKENKSDKGWNSDTHTSVTLTHSSDLVKSDTHKHVEIKRTHINNIHNESYSQRGAILNFERTVKHNSVSYLLLCLLRLENVEKK